MTKPMNNDILSGRGAGVNLHPGNMFFRSLIQSGKDAYIAADPGEKKRIIKQIVEAATKSGRFLKQDPKTELWVPISLEEAKRKTGQALRENAPAIKKQQDEIKQKLKLVNQLQSARPNCLPPITKEIETVPVSAPASVISPTLTQMASNYVPPPIMPTNPPQLSATHLLWTRMNVLNEKQEQLKRKQRELEDEQSQIMQCFFQMSAPMTTPMAPLDFLYNGARSDIGSDSETDQIYAQSHKKRRIIDTRH
jgi:DNA repair exonuclease SbcCD ATPase subunit